MINFIAISPDRDRLVIQWEYDELTTVHSMDMGEEPYTDEEIPADYTTLLDIPEDEI